jgi:hypothetical protein
MNYKEEQQKTRAKLREVNVLHLSPRGSAPLTLGIKQFKRDNPNRKDAHGVFKENVWNSMVRNQDK